MQAGVHPEEPGRLLGREQFESIWRHSVDLLQRGFKSGSILTVDPEEAAALGPPWQRRCVHMACTCYAHAVHMRTHAAHVLAAPLHVPKCALQCS
jgi:hypothetical protein